MTLMRWMGSVAFAVSLCLSAAPQQSRDKAEVALRAAMEKETIEGNLKGAIDEYKKLAQNANKSVAARALVRLGECYEKQSSADARKTYEQVLSRFADQTEAVAQARARLVAIGGPTLAKQQTTSVVWSGAAVDPEGTISPDGRYLSHPDWKTGNVALHDFASGTERTVTTDGSWKSGEAEFAEETAISRDGKRVAYGWYQSKTKRFSLRIAELIGDPNPRTIFESPDMRYIGPKDWSPDGKWIVIAMEPENSDARSNEPVQPGQTAAIGLIAVEDGSPRIVKRIEWNGSDSGFGNVRLSPDGRYVAYDRPANTVSVQRDIFVAALESSREVPIAASPAHEQLVGWSPDGKNLLFTSNRTGSTGLWAVAIADGVPQGEGKMLKPDIGRIVPVGISASGSLYYCLPRVLDPLRIQLARFDFTTGRLLSAPEILNEEGRTGEESPAWSPDGKSLAYVSRWSFGFGTGSYVGDQETSIRVRRIDTGEVRNIRSGIRGWVNDIRWAPDGRSLLAAGWPNPAALLRFDAQTGKASTIFKLPRHLSSPILSQDGKSVFCTKTILRENVPGTDKAFVQVDLASGEECEIIRRPTLGGLNLSPDENYIATGSVDRVDGAKTFLIIPVAGGAPSEAVRIPADAKQITANIFAWTPGNRSVLIRKRLSSADSDVELWEGFIDGRAPRKFEGKLDPVLANAGIWVHPDGKRIAILPAAPPRTREKSPAQILVLDNFLPTGKPVAEH